MKSYNKFWSDIEIVQERVLNLFDKHQEERKKYAQEVFDLLQKAYRKVDGIKGNGFESPEAMTAKIPFWKLVRKNDKIVTVVMYKAKDGRKMVAAGTDGSDVGKEGLNKQENEYVCRY